MREMFLNPLAGVLRRLGWMTTPQSFSPGSNVPKIIVKYTLVTPFPRKRSSKFDIGEYSDGTRRYLVKTSQHVPFQRVRKLLANEVQINRALEQVKFSGSKNQEILIPPLCEVKEEPRSLSLVYEYVEGTRISAQDPHEVVRSYLAVHSYLLGLTDQLLPFRGRGVPTRNAWVYLLTFPVIFTVFCVRYPWYSWFAFRALIRSIPGVLQIFSEPLVFSHRDITLNNVFISESGKYCLCDFELAVFAPRSVDVVTMFLNADSTEARALIFAKYRDKINTMILVRQLLLAVADGMNSEYSCDGYLDILRAFAQTGNPLPSTPSTMELREEERSSRFQAEIVIAPDANIKKQWAELAQRSGEMHVSASPAWLDAAQEAFGEKDFAIVLVRDEERKIVAALPLVRTRIFGVSVYTSPGREFISDPPYLVNEGKEYLLGMLLEKAKELGCVYLLNLAVGGERLATLLPHQAMLFQSDKEVLFPRSQDDVYGRFGAAQARRLWKKVKGSGTHLSIETGDGRNTELLGQCFEIDEQSVKHIKGKGVFFREDARVFYLGLANRAPELLRIVVLYFDGVPVTYKISFATSTTYVNSQKAYIPGYERLKPGALSLLTIIESDLPDSISTISLGKGVDQFKLKFSDTVRPLFSLVIGNVFLRWYLSLLLQAREALYAFLVGHPKLYSGFRRWKVAFLSSQPHISSVQEKRINNGRPPTLTVAIPAYNEERSIGNILTSLLAQQSTNFVFERIAVYDDGSTDDTASIVNEIAEGSNIPIDLVRGPARRGKMTQLNSMFQDNTSDLLVVLDADIGLDGNDFLERFVAGAESDPTGVVYAAHQITLRPRGIFKQILYSTYALWDDIRLSVPDRDHVQCFYGAATIYRKDFAKSLVIPSQSAEERTYIYLMAKKVNGFRYISNVAIKYWPPLSWKDYWAHTERSFGNNQPELQVLFGDIANTAHIVPTKYKLIGIARSCIHRPLLTPIAVCANTMFRFVHHNKTRPATALWEIATSTKKPFPKGGGVANEGLPFLIISSYDDLKNPYYGGGGAVAVHEVAKRLAKTYEIVILAGNYRGAEDGVIDGVEYKHIGLSIMGPHIGQFLFHLVLPFHAFFRKYDLWVESFTPPYSTSFLPLFTKRPVVGLVHMLSGKDMERKYHLPFTRIEDLGLRCYRWFITLTETTRTYIHEKNQRAAIEVIGNGVSSPKTIDDNTGLENTHLTFLGRIEIDQKGLDLLLDAFERVIKHQNVQLVIAGSGIPAAVDTLHSHIELRGLADNVKMVGRVGGEEKDRLYRNTLIGLQPSRYEQFSLSMLEMMSYGVAVVCFDIPGFSWAPKDAIFRVPAFDAEQFANAIITLISDNELRKRMASRAREYALSQDWGLVAKKYEEFFRNILKNHAV